VNVLKKKEYECEECAYSWTPEPAECCGNGAGCCDPGCDVGCAAPGEAAGEAEAQPAPADEPPAAPEPAAATGQRTNWFDSAKSSVSKTTTLPVRFLRAAASSNATR
jgi:hypothetical protein